MSVVFNEFQKMGSQNHNYQGESKVNANNIGNLRKEMLDDEEYLNYLVVSSKGMNEQKKEEAEWIKDLKRDVGLFKQELIR